MEFAVLTIVILFCAFSILMGFFLHRNPSLAIELQKRFYEKINWRIEPVSMEKEIRNTRFMGLLLIIATITTIIIMVLSFKVGADEDDELSGKGVTQLEDFGGGEYMTGDGKILQMEDLGGGDYMTTADELLQTDDLSGEDRLTSEEKILQIEGAQEE